MKKNDIDTIEGAVARQLIRQSNLILDVVGSKASILDATLIYGAKRVDVEKLRLRLRKVKGII